CRNVIHRPVSADAGAGRGRFRVRGPDARHDDRHDHAVLLVLRDLSRLLRRANPSSAGSADHAGTVDGSLSRWARAAQAPALVPAELLATALAVPLGSIPSSLVK